MFSVPKVAVVNESTVVPDDLADRYAKALDWQANHDYAPAYGLAAGAVVAFYPKAVTPPRGSWVLAILDDADQAGALGYHDVTAAGLPMGKVFARTAMKYGASVSVTASHELLEMLGDPLTSEAVLVPSADYRSVRVYAKENADACEDDSYGYKGWGDVLVSDFVYPAFWDVTSPPRRFDHSGHVTAPLQVLKGGYLAVMDARGVWSQVTARGLPHHSASTEYRGNRYHKRAGLLGHGKTRRSTAC